ncbi:2-keto-3-deoxy-phosphogluconate aldolase [Micromonospora rhizosphaerae]|uniref:2-keto-3-deoxy-phosphogluconate aldolase n=1 Tax=Micromonospora rhizosphaerae TaxID=568872 RepID=A0A1C6RSX1_9ACTN|nr:bifunctional 4-hydroxy-2-oxoglutarate aldolase/2-dehydro-3-deoxy-phosphogluconate aldolase [Micromonospora rhizosphaerae]SCL20281.1 2-keto-3-deoxy-phosphogluconate aldolase [Micromonospora rhizosphaerae]
MGHGIEDIFGSAVVMAILRGLPPRETVELATRAWDLGIDVVEVPVQTTDAVRSLKAAVAAGRERGRGVGAGTVITVDQVRTVAEIGVTFTVAPGLDDAVVAASVAAGLPHLPGVSTASEIQQALRHGLTWVKAFPANVLRPDWFVAMRAPFPQVTFVATGGVDAHNAPDYLAAGARVVAVGSALSDPEQLERLAAVLAEHLQPTESGRG